MVYLLDNNNNEFPADSLKAEPGNIFSASRVGYSGDDQFGTRRTYFDTLESSILFDSLRLTRFYKNYYNWYTYRRFDFYNLTYGIGISYWEMSQGGQAVYLSDVTIVLKGCIINGIVYGDTTYYKFTDVKDNYSVKEFSLSQNYPNPFNPSTRIKYSLEKGGSVSLKIYDMLGREIETLVNRYEGPGNYEVEFAPKSLSDGVYIYRLQAGTNYLLKKMIYLK
jgi:Secretion system C-terminal sorting domain